jgi:hypothetical protein
MSKVQNLKPQKNFFECIFIEPKRRKNIGSGKKFIHRKRRSTIDSIFERENKKEKIIRISFVKAKTSFFWENKIFTLKKYAGDFYYVFFYVALIKIEDIKRGRWRGTKLSGSSTRMSSEKILHGLEN